MPVVPRIQLQATMTSDPHVRMDVPQMKDYSQEQVAQLGQAAQNFGAQIGNIALAMQKEANDTRVLDAVNKANRVGLELTYGDNGYTHLKGEAAMNRPDGKPIEVEYMENLGKQFEGIESRLGNSAQRQAFRQWASQYQGKFNEGLFKHESEQSLAYQEAVDVDTLNTQSQVLVHDYDKPEAVQVALANMSAAFLRSRQRQGVPAQALERQHQTFMSDLHSHIVGQAVQKNDLDYGVAYLEQYGSQMTQQAFQAAQKMLGQEVNIKVASDVSNSLFTANPNITEGDLEHVLKTVPEVAENPERMELVKTDIMAKQRAKAEQERELRETSMVQVQKALQESGGNWLALPAAVRSALPKDIEPYAKAYAKSLVKPVKISSADAYLHLNDASKLTQMSDANFEMMRTALSEEDFDFYATQRAAYKEAKATGKGVQKMPTVLNMVEVNKQMDGILGMLKIKTKPEEMSTFDKAKVSVIRKVFNKHLLESQMAEGKSYTKEEVANKLSEFVAEQVLKRGAEGAGLGTGKTAKRDIFTVQLSDISTNDMLRIRNDFAWNGVDYPTQEQIVQAYLEKGDFKETHEVQIDPQSREIAAQMKGEFGSAFENEDLYSASYGQRVGGLTANANSTIVAGDDPLEFKWELPPELREAKEKFNRKLNPLYFIVDFAKAGFIGYRRRQERLERNSEKVYAPENITPEVQEDYLEIIKLLYPETKESLNPQDVNVNVVKAVDSILNEIHECSRPFMIPHFLFTFLYSPPSTPLEVALAVGQAEGTGTFKEWADVLREDQVYIACKNKVLVSDKKTQIFGK